MLPLTTNAQLENSGEVRRNCPEMREETNLQIERARDIPGENDRDSLRMEPRRPRGTAVLPIKTLILQRHSRCTPRNILQSLCRGLENGQCSIF